MTTWYVTNDEELAHAAANAVPNDQVVVTGGDYNSCGGGPIDVKANTMSEAIPQHRAQVDLWTDAAIDVGPGWTWADAKWVEARGRLPFENEYIYPSWPLSSPTYAHPSQATSALPAKDAEQ